MKIRKYDLAIYALSIIRQGAKDYSHIAKVVVAPDKKQATCYFIWCKTDEERTVDEFSNYLIDLIGAGGNNHDCS